MSIRIFSLKNVPDDETIDVKDLLTEHQIEFYETPAGKWGISVPALWLKDDTQLLTARSLIEKYQQDRTIRVREEYERQKKAGKAPTIIDKVKEEPLKMVLYLTIIGFIMYVSIRPFLTIGF
jgi:hypothetical protein